MTEINHLSYSSIAMYLTCPRQWAFKYIEKLPTTTSPALIFGSAWHQTVENYIATASPILSTWSEEWGKQLSKNPNVDWGMDTPETHYNEGVRMLQSPDIMGLINQIKPKKRAEGHWIETEVRLQVPGVPVPIIGYIDVITEDGIPGDIKTSSKSWSNDKAISELQPLFYLAAMNQAGMQTPGYRFRHYIFVKTKKPQAQMIEHVHNIKQIVFLFKMITNVWKAIELGVFPENPTGWACNPVYCSFWRDCRGKYE